MKKNIVIIGAGNVATQIAKELHQKGHNILQVYSRTIESASLLAQQVNANYTIELDKLIADADFYIFSVKDSVLEDVIASISNNRGIWIHTSGSMPMTIFKEKTSNHGVLYPLQTFNKEKDINWQEIPLFLEASDDDTYNAIWQLASALSDKIFPLSSDKRQYIHLSGVFACNFVNHMYDLANQFVTKTGLPYEVLLPLIDETSRKVHLLNPHDAQTGPAIRYDENVINKHLKLIEEQTTKEIYRLLSESIHQKHQ